MSEHLKKDCKLFYDEGFYKGCCVLCGTPRPEPKKGLKEKLRDTYTKSDSLETWGLMATCALEHFVAVVDETTKVAGCVNVWVNPQILKRAMEDSLNG